MSSEYIESSLRVQDKQLDQSIRPSVLTDFVGQKEVRNRLSIMIGAAKKRSEHLGHILFCGPPGLGKTTLSTIVAKEMGTNIISLSAPSIEKAGDLVGILTSLQKGDVLFIDEIHRLQRTIEEYLYSAMEDYALDIMIDSGSSARSIRVEVPPFTLVGATTRLSMLSGPLRTRFAAHFRLDFYDEPTIAQIVDRSASILNIPTTQDAALEIARRARGTPRIANNMLKWVRDYAQVHHNDSIDKKVCLEALAMLHLDDLGLDVMDKKILTTIIEDHMGGPVGIGTIAAALSEDADTLADVHEPYLIMKGLLKRTQRGREATQKAYKHLNIPQQPEA